MKHTPYTLLALLGLVGGCGSSPIPDFYTLYPEPGATAANVAVQIELRRPGLPGYLDRPNIVRRQKAGRLDISGTERWGTQLTELVGSTLAENLEQRLPRSTVYTDSGAISAEPDLVVEIDLQRFESTEEGVVRLDVQVAVHRADVSEAALVKRYELTKKPKSDDTDDMVAAMSNLLAELSEAIAGSIAEVASGGGTGGDETPEGDAPVSEAAEPSSLLR